MVFTPVSSARGPRPRPQPLRALATAPAPAAPKPAAAPTAAGDTLTTTAPSVAPAAKPLTLREQVAAAEKLMGKKTFFKNDTELQAYLTSLEKAMPQEGYDRQDFLASLGLTNLRASGRTDRPVLDAVRQIPGYRPHTHMPNGGEIWVQQRFFDLAVEHPRTFMALTKVANPVIEAKGKLEGDWKKPFVAQQTPVPSNVKPEDRYKDALASMTAIGWRFESDFHGGLPTVENPTHPIYGTYQVARKMGFDDAAARRFGANSNGIDFNTTPYGKSSPSPLDQIDRHFNLDRKAQDTRLVYAKNHLDAAIAFAKVGSYEQAEIELGCGLHSLQDIFAHGQISPALHGTLGQFPDEVEWNPVGFYEATAATAAYLAAYLEAITKPDNVDVPAAAR